MKPAIAIKTGLCLLAITAAPAFGGPEFFLFHGPTETVLGPYEFETGQKLGSSEKPWSLTVGTPTTFSLATRDGETAGPFAFAENAAVKIGSAEFTLSTNAEVMLGKRVDQKMWNKYPETNPKILSILRDAPADGYKFIRAEPDAVFIATPKGIIKIRLALLPEDIQQKYAYDPAKADAYAKAQAASQEAWKQKQLDEAKAKADDLQKLWENATPITVAQPDYPEAHFKTGGGLGTSTPVGGNNNNNNNNNSGNGNSGGYGALHIKNLNNQNSNRSPRN